MFRVQIAISGIGDLEAAWLLSSIGISNTIGRIVFGFLSDRKCINRLLLYNTALVICGAGTTVGPLLTSFWSLLIYTVVFGVFSGKVTFCYQIYPSGQFLGICPCIVKIMCVRSTKNSNISNSIMLN